jgi:hypothetical protein
MDVNEMFSPPKLKFVRGDYEEYFLVVCNRIAHVKSTKRFREMSVDVSWTTLYHVPKDSTLHTRDEMDGAYNIRGRNTSFCKETE